MLVHIYMLKSTKDNNKRRCFLNIKLTVVHTAGQKKKGCLLSSLYLAITV